jgi:hypothetical protein
VVVIFVPAVTAGNEVNVLREYSITHFAPERSTDVTILQHIVLQQILQHLRMCDFIIDYRIHRF